MSDLNKPIIMFDMDGTLLDLAFDDLIWNHKLPERHAQAHQCTLAQSHDTLYAFYQEHKHTLSWYSSRYWTAKVGVDVLQLQYDFERLFVALMRIKTKNAYEYIRGEKNSLKI